MVLNVSLISSAFNLIYVITDQVLGFVGGHLASHLGKDTEGTAKNVFLAGAQTGPTVIGQTQRTLADKRAAQAALKGPKGKGKPGETDE